MVRPWPNPSYIYGRVPPFYGLSILGTTPPFQIRVVEWAWTFHILCSKGEKIDSNFKPLWLLLIESIKSCISALLLLLADVWPKEERRAKSPFHRCYEGWFMIRMMANYSNIWIAVTLTNCQSIKGEWIDICVQALSLFLLHYHHQRCRNRLMMPLIQQQLHFRLCNSSPRSEYTMNTMMINYIYDYCFIQRH